MEAAKPFSTAMVVAALFVSQIAAGIYRGLDREPPDELPPLVSAALIVSLATWFWSFCRTHRAEWLLDMGWFLLMAWPIVIPYYVFRYEGRRGLLRVGLFALTYFAAWATGWAVSIWMQVLFDTE